jgi:hypothetical protein
LTGSSEEDLAAELSSARAEVDELTGKVRYSFAAFESLPAAYERLHVAERRLAASRGQQYAVPVDFGTGWDVAVPSPYLFAATRIACVLFDLGDPAPTIGVLEFIDVHSIRMGMPNDEAIEGHPLHGKGLGSYGAYEVHNSLLLEEHIRMNSVHPHHQEATWRRLHHYVLLFHDEMLECLAGGTRTHTAKGWKAAKALAQEIVER